MAATHGHVEFAAEANTALRFGTMLLTAGASGYRVMRAVKRCARSLGFDNADVLVGFNTISCTFHHGDEFRTVVADVALPGVNASRIEALETTAHSMLRNYHTAEEINAALDDIERIPSPRWSPGVASVAAGIACAGFAVLNQFGYQAALIVLVAAAAGQLIRIALHAKHLNLLGATAIAAWAASSIYLIAAYLLPTSGDLSAGFIASVLFLIPGFPLFSSFVDLARFDFTAGIPRLCFALEIITVIMLTVSVVAMLSGTPPPVAPSHEPGWEYFIAGAVASLVAVGGFAILFNSSRRMALIAAVLGTIANVARLALLSLGVRGFLASFAGALVVGLVGAYAGKLAAVPRVTVTIPACVVMIPGATIYTAVHSFAQGDTPEALYAFTDVTLTVLFLAAGLTIARMCTDRAWAFAHYIDFDKRLGGRIHPLDG